MEGKQEGTVEEPGSPHVARSPSVPKASGKAITITRMRLMNTATASQ